MTEKQPFIKHPLALAVFASLNIVSVAHAVSPNVVISQVYGGGGNSGSIYKNDFIELFNRGSTPQSLSGWSVQYASATGTAYQVTNLTNVDLQPGQYYLVQEAQGAGGTTNLPTPDAIGTIGMAGGAGKVALVNSTTALTSVTNVLTDARILDYVGFGATANLFEGAGPTPAPSNTASASRTTNGCTDTDTNSTDFTSGVVNPRNTASTINPCSGSSSATVSINDVSITEGNSGTTTLTFTVTRSDTAGAFSVDYATADGTASTADNDYVAASGTVSFIAGGATTQNVSVTVNGDTAIESNETLTVTLSNLASTTGTAIISDNQGLGTINNDDTAPNACGDPATLISTVQGSGAATTLTGSTSIEGIVVGDYQGTAATSLRGFFVQEEDADSDGNAATSEGIFVFDGTNGNSSVSVGDKVRVTGTPAEFFNMTQLSTLTSVQVCATGQTLPIPATLTLPVPNVPNGNLTTATDAINAYYEAFEGMLVTFPTTLKVSEYFELERYGQLLLSQGGRIPTFTNVSNPSSTGYINHQIKLAKRQIILDDKNNTQNAALTNNTALFYPTDGSGGAVDGLSITNRFRGGDTINNLTGVLHWSFAGFTGTDAWRIRPVDEIYDYVFTSANKRKAAPPDVGGTLRVASFNVLNFFTGIDAGTPICGPGSNQDCRGADSSVELDRQKAKVGAALCGLNADIIGIMEVENNATASLQGLVDAANLVCGSGTYDFINTGTIGSDAIKVGLLYKTATVSPINSHAVLTSSFNANFIDTKNRPTLAQTFQETASGERLTVAVNHLKSKGSDCLDVSDPDQADGQGNCNQTRNKAAEVLVDWLATNPTGVVDPDYLIIGDLNSYAKEDPIKTIEKGPDNTASTTDDYTNLVKKFGGTAAYSYVFDGQTGYLDHALASASLTAQVTGAGDWHINADEPPSFDYNDAIDDGAGEQDYEVKPSVPTLQGNRT